MTNTPATELPLFPLRQLLFPEGYLPLRIFEPRYLAMVQRCFAAGQPFGVVARAEGDEAIAPDSVPTEPFRSTGTLARIESLDRVQPGLLYTRARGGQRFRVLGARAQADGLWLGRVELLSEDAGVPVPDDLQPAVQGLQGLLAAWTSELSPAELPIQPPLRWDDAGWVANRWAELLPLPAEERYRLMTLDNPLLRLELVSDRLDGLARLRPEQ